MLFSLYYRYSLFLWFWLTLTFTLRISGVSVVYAENEKGNGVTGTNSRKIREQKFRNNDNEENNTNNPIIVQTVVNGAKNIVLECPLSLNELSNSTTTNNNKYQFQWFYNGKHLENTTRRYQIGSNLFISTIDKEDDGGIFKCEAFNGSLTRQRLESDPMSLNIIWISTQTSTHLLSPGESNGVPTPSSITIAKPGDNLILECWVEGTSSIQFNWYKNGHPLNQKPHSNFHNSKHNQRVHLENVTLEDNGSYYCTAWNDAGIAGTFSKFDLIVSSGETNTKILIPPSNLVGKKHETIRFDCVWENGRIGKWFINETNLIQNTSRIELLNNGSLLLHRLRDSDEGIYKCALEQTSFVGFLKIASLKELSIDSLDPVPRIQGNKLALAENISVEIICSQPEGWPIPRIWWEDPKGNLINSKGTNAKAHVLWFPKLTKTHNGIYTCFAQNIAQTTRVSFELVSTEKPVILSSPMDRTVQESSTTKLSCPFQGSPFPVSRIHWFRNGLPLKYDNRIINLENNSTLVIKNIEPGDSGDYTCEIITPGYSPVHSEGIGAKVLVTETLKFFPIPLDRKLETNSSQKIHCRARGSPMPIINWTKDIGKANPLPLKTHNGILQFPNVQKSDAGTYTCIAFNTQGEISATINVDVFSSPKFILSPKNPTEALEGQSIILPCFAHGDPPPTIQWDRSLEMIGIEDGLENTQRFQVLENGSLWIREVISEDHGERFGCTAGNSGGFRREEVEMLVIRTNPDALEGSDGLMTRTISITLSVAAGYMLLVIGLMLWCRYRQLKRKQEYLIEVRKEIGDTELLNGGTTTVNGTTPIVSNGNGVNGHIPKKPSSIKSEGELTAKSTHSSKLASATASVISHRSGGSTQSKRSVATSSGYDRITIPRNELSFVLLLGHGEFGEVFLAKAKLNFDDFENSGKESGESLVMVKALQTREESALLEFKIEIEMYYKLNHENVTRLWGLCREMDPHYMIMEYSDWGDLKQFLLATRPDHPKTPKPPPLSTLQILHTIRQVALGMEHLSNHRFLHKDLATRNCLISTGLRIQISNPGLNKDTYSLEYVSYRNQSLPLRWLPYEAVLEDDYSTKSDVWSWGTLTWEVIHSASIPFPNSSNEKVIELLEKNEISWNSLTDLPDGTPKALQALLQKCWDNCPSHRPTFTTIVLSLDDIIREIDAKK